MCCVVDHAKSKMDFLTDRVKPMTDVNLQGVLFQEKKKHTTLLKKPVWLMESLLKTLSNKGDVVLDMFMGSQQE